MKKYICSTEYFPNCRVHDGGFTGSIQFFETADELRDWVLKCMNDSSIQEIYDPEGGEAGLIKYELDGSHHRCTGVNLYIEKDFWKVADDGSGNKRWVKEEREDPK